jgi:hypothetical protein
MRQSKTMSWYELFCYRCQVIYEWIMGTTPTYTKSVMETGSDCPYKRYQSMHESPHSTLI